MTKYPRDEFDDVPEGTERRGVHRVVQAGSGTRLRPILAAGAAALLLGVIAYFALPSMGARAVSQPETSNSPSTSASAKPSPKSTPSASKPPVASPSPTATATTPAVNMALVVSVYNGTTTPGLAATYGQKVTAGGWKLGAVANWQGVAQPSSVVFYNNAESKATASAVAAAAGITRVEQAADLTEPIVVVVGPGAAG
ncbi:LytR C-terminal domain-containing protein [Arthrobacter sp. NPDC090010]|uniref:LytR C-terminal domain-containing protein n=1 Tax=Arthrobacter sp. NPDC090010 TaxID=3363942 RepID=UPI00382F02FA